MLFIQSFPKKKLCSGCIVVTPPLYFDIHLNSDKKRSVMHLPSADGFPPNKNSANHTGISSWQVCAIN